MLQSVASETLVDMSESMEKISEDVLNLLMKQIEDCKHNERKTNRRLQA